MTTGYHESDLSNETRELHRGLASLIEELEAIDWYQQRVDVSHDEELKAVLAHNRDEEVEHAVMTLEWLRRNIPHLDLQMRKYLFVEGAIARSDEALRSRGPGDLGIGRT